jgi:hypothetical protein
VELQLDRLLHSSSRIRRRPNLFETKTPTFDDGIGWNLGLMRNVSDSWALGGTVSFGSGSVGPVTGLRVRARRWLDPFSSLELEAGSRASNVGELVGTGSVWGPSVGTRVNLRERVSVFVRWDGVRAPGGTDRSGAEMDPAFQHGFYVGAALGSTWTLVGSAVLGALAIWFYTQDWEEDG